VYASTVRSDPWLSCPEWGYVRIASVSPGQCQDCRPTMTWNRTRLPFPTSYVLKIYDHFPICLVVLKEERAQLPKVSSDLPSWDRGQTPPRCTSEACVLELLRSLLSSSQLGTEQHSPCDIASPQNPDTPVSTSLALLSACWDQNHCSPYPQHMLMGRCPADLTANSLLWEVRAVFIQMMYYVYLYQIRCAVSLLSLNFA